MGRHLDELAKRIEQFRIDALRFFAGDLKLPPEALKETISTNIRSLRSQRSQGAAERFRLGSLEAKFNSQVDLYNRRMREREVGARRPPVEDTAPPDPREGVVIGRSSDGNAVEVLYQGLYLGNGQRAPNMDLEKFRGYISRQADVIRAKTGCSDIHFRVAVEDGKMKIKAKPLK